MVKVGDETSDFDALPGGPVAVRAVFVALVAVFSGCHHPRHARASTTSSSVPNAISSAWSTLTTKLQPRPPIERQREPEVAPRKVTSSPGCAVAPVQGGPPMPYRVTPGPNEPPRGSALSFGRPVYNKEIFLGTEVGGRREGPFVHYLALEEWEHDEYATSTVREGVYVGGVKAAEEREYVRGTFTRLFTRGPGPDEFEAVARCGAVVTERTHYRNEKKHGTEELFFADGRKYTEATWRDGVMVGVLRRWNEEGGLIEETAFSERGLQESTRRWSDGVLVLEQHGGFKVTRYANGLKQSEVIPADAQFLGVKRAWFENGQPQLSVDVNAAGFQVGTARHWLEDGRELSADEWAARSRDAANRKSMEVLEDLLMIPFSVLCALK